MIDKISTVMKLIPRQSNSIIVSINLRVMYAHTANKLLPQPPFPPVVSGGKRKHHTRHRSKKWQHAQRVSLSATVMAACSQRQSKKKKT